MIVGKRMSSPIITVAPDLPLPDAFKLMKQENIRRLVVVEDGKMVGLITENDLENAMPSKATSLSIWELNYLIEKVTVGDIMIKDIITVTYDTVIEEAARVMVDNKISALPILRNNEVVGIITETDIFCLFLELFGARHKGVRVTAIISIKPGSIASLTKAIYDVGGDIISVGTFDGDSLSSDLITIKVRGVDEEKLQEAIKPVIIELVDIRVV